MTVSLAVIFSIGAKASDNIIPADSGKTNPADTSFFEYEEEPEEIIVSYDFFDSLKATFLVERAELSSSRDKTFAHDPSGLLKFDPDDFIVNYQALPMRRTVYPSGLPGNRFDVVLDTRTLNPLEHTLEPDGKIDLEDYPMAPVEYAWNIEGPLGMAFDADNAVGTLYLIPYEDIDGQAKSGLRTGNGDFGYANTRGYFAAETKEKRVLKAAAEYRKADGSEVYFDDDAYHQWAETIIPLNDRNRVSFTGRLYKRDGSYPFIPQFTGVVLNQFRRDRDFNFGFARDHENGGKSVIEFRHQRSESKLENNSSGVAYSRKIDNFDNGGHIRHENRFGDWNTAAGLYLNQYEYKDNGWDQKRKRAKLYANVMKGDSTKSLLLYSSVEKMGGFDPAPSVMLAYQRKSDKYYWQFSAAYKTKLPGMYELFLSPDLSNPFDIPGDNYFEVGNRDLVPEKQAIANFNAGYGANGNDWLLSLTGGEIFDGIDWNRSEEPMVAPVYDLWSPVNHDIEFVDASLIKRFSLWDRIWLYGGTTWRHVSIDGNDDPPYSPDLQGFAALELYQYFEFIDTHLYGYIEAQLHDDYRTEGNIQFPARIIGREAIVNLRLSVRIKKFRFYFVSQNLMAKVYQMRDGYPVDERLNYYGIIWDFLN